MSYLKRRCLSVIFAAGLASAIVALNAIGSNAATIGYWRFEGDDAGFLADSSGNGFTLTKGATDDPIYYPTQYTLPSSGAGAGFDDPIPQNGLANASAASFTPPSGTGIPGQSFQHADEEMFYATKFTVEAYIRRVADPNTTTDTIIAAQYDGTGVNERSWGFRIKDNGTIMKSTLALGISTNGTNSQGFYSNYSLDFDTDYFVAVTFDLSKQIEGVMFYCKNLETGVWRVSGENHTVTELHDSTGQFRIGAYFDSLSAKWSGLIDEVRWSNTVLAPNELLVPVQRIPGDANSDGKVNDDDAAAVAANWQTTVTGWTAWRKGDFNEDGYVNDLDAALMAANWNYGVTDAAVPEPSTLALAVIGIAGAILLLVRRK